MKKRLLRCIRNGKAAAKRRNDLMAIELLSPAGNLEKMETAFNFGADAVYMGLTNFSLRANAENFRSEDMEKVASLKRANGKKIYCTMNILFKESQIEQLYKMKDEIAAWPFDAFLISDMGLVPFFQKYCPGKQLHLSTQASCLNSESAKMYHSMGFSRIVLGREASLDDIKRIKDKAPELELEAFVHGAMCMAYSGRCLLSAHLAGRSGNQGDCSHTCRWKYKMHYALEEEERPGKFFPIEEEDGYTTILSSKDLCMIDHVKKLEDAGLSSLKIEGRMKSTYYVALVTRAYRKAIDDAPDKDEYKKDLWDVSHRQYTTGFYFSSSAVEEKDDVFMPTSYGYERKFMFLGTIRDKVKDGIYALDVKNQIKAGQEIEFIAPDIHSLPDSRFILLDEDFNEVSQADHGKTFYIKTSLELKNGYMIRRECEDKIVR